MRTSATTTQLCPFAAPNKPSTIAKWKGGVCKSRRGMIWWCCSSWYQLEVENISLYLYPTAPLPVPSHVLTLLLSLRQLLKIPAWISDALEHPSLPGCHTRSNICLCLAFNAFVVYLLCFTIASNVQIVSFLTPSSSTHCTTKIFPTIPTHTLLCIYTNCT